MSVYRKGLGAKQTLSEEQMGWLQKHPEAALKSDISGCLSLKMRRLPDFLMSVVVCEKMGDYWIL